MSEKNTEIRLSCTYIDPDNTIDKLAVEVRIDSEWQAFDITTRSPGFLLFNYALFSCQHLYFRANAAERGLKLVSSTGRLATIADSNWKIKSLNVNFTGQLKSGEPNQDSIDYIVERMGHCPVSSNLSEITDSKTMVSFE